MPSVMSVRCVDSPVSRPASPRPIRRALPLLAGAAALAALLAGCGSSDPAASESEPSTSAVAFSDIWVKAADSGMTAAFGELSNSSEDDVALLSASSPAAARVELHEMAMTDSGMVMRPKEGGFTLPAGESVTLQPGGLHLMLMGITAPIEAGDTVPLTLTFDDGSTLEVAAVAKPFSGAEEDYEPSGSASPMPTMGG